MLKKQIYWILLLTLLGIVSCGDDDGFTKVDRVSLLRFEFPQGDDPWDKEIEQIAKDWGMYIIYKDVDSTHLNRMWTSPIYYDPIYVCKQASSEELQVYLNLVTEWLLGNLDKTKESDRKLLPFYLYLVNDLDDGNPKSKTYKKRHIRLKQDGLDYWSLSFKTEELQAGLTREIIHNVASAFSYPGIRSRFEDGEYVIDPDFASMTDYETPVGQRYYSFEEWKKANPWAPDFYYTDCIMVHPSETDPDNEFKRRGFAPQISENFVAVTSYYGAPTWMQWIVKVMVYPEWSFTDDRNPGPVEKDINRRVLKDFLNMIRIAMIYPEEKVRELFPIDAENPLDRAGFQIINAKYDLVVEYMKNTYQVDLQKYAAILNE